MKFFEREPEQRRRNEPRPIKPDDANYQAMKQAIKGGANPEVNLLKKLAAIDEHAKQRKMTDPIPRPGSEGLARASGDTLERDMQERAAGELESALGEKRPDELRERAE